MSDKVEKMYETKQEYRNAVVEYKKDIKEFFEDKFSIYNLSVKMVLGNKICIAFKCDVNLDSNHIIDFCEKFGLEKTVLMNNFDNGFGKTYSYKFWKDI